MKAKAATWVGAFLLAFALVLLLVVYLNLFPWILLALGLLLFTILIVGLLLAAVLLIFAAPYYFVTKPAQITTGSSMGIERLKEP
jgi:hypothetical protein